MTGALDGRVVVVSVAEVAAARARARGAAVVVVGTDAEAVGRSVEQLAAGGARVCAFVGDPANDADGAALAEMVAELFPDRWDASTVTTRVERIQAANLTVASAAGSLA